MPQIENWKLVGASPGPGPSLLGPLRHRWRPPSKLPLPLPGCKGSKGEESNVFKENYLEAGNREHLFYTQRDRDFKSLQGRCDHFYFLMSYCSNLKLSKPMFVSEAKFYWKYLFFLFQQGGPVLRDSCRPVTVSSCLCLPH